MEIADAFRKVTEVYKYVGNLFFNLDDNCESNGFNIPYEYDRSKKFPNLLIFSYNKDEQSKFINTEWGEIHSIIKLYQRKDEQNKDEHLYGVATLFDFCDFCSKPLLVIAKYTCGLNSTHRETPSYTTFWRYYWPIQRRIHNEFVFIQDTDYYKSEPLDKKYNIKKTIFKEFDLFEFLCNNTNPKESIEERIFKELNEIQKLYP